MKRHLNTLFITTNGAYLAKEGEAVVVRINKKPRLRVPIHNLGGVVCLGRIGISPSAMALCAKGGVTVSFLSTHGRFLASVHGFTPGNVLLRRKQYRVADEEAPSSQIARNVVAAKIANSRAVLLRALRDRPSPAGRLQATADWLTDSLGQLRSAENRELIRGIEGNAARMYFDVFNELITDTGGQFVFRGRSRRPPLDNVNAVLSFLYAMLAQDCRAACEAAGLDAAVGFLHADRPGRPGLALDLMEEFRAFLADRLALSLINRGQIKASGFATTETGAVQMDDATRKAVITAWQNRKQREIRHPFLGEKTTVGLLPHLQARLLARHLRGEMDDYPPFLWK